MVYDLTYERANSDSGGPQPGTTALRDYVLFRWPPSRSLGVYNYRPIRGSTNLSVHSEGRAWDCGVPVNDVGKIAGDEIAEFITSNATRLGIQYLIWFQRSWRHDRGWRPYRGASPHIDHLHIEQTRAAAANLTRDDIEEAAAPAIPRGPVVEKGLVWDPPLALQSWRSAVSVQGGSVIMSPGGDIYCPTSKYYGGPNDEILGREFDMLGEPDYLLTHPTIPDGYIVVTDLGYPYAYPNE
jgi:hypothetical protein